MGKIGSQLPAMRSEKSLPTSPTARNTRFNQNDARALIARLLVNWPYRREEVLDEHIYKLMQAELVQHFGTYDRTLVSEAVTVAISRSEQWPAPAVILKCIKELRVVPSPVRHQPPKDDGYRPPTPAELARVAEALTSWRKGRATADNAKDLAATAADDLASLSRPFTAAEIESAKRLRGIEP